MIREPWRCPHCRARSYAVACVTCNRDMCEDCISFGDAGKVCGLCKDREDGRKRYDRLCVGLNQEQVERLPDFDEWYDVNA